MEFTSVIPIEQYDKTKTITYKTLDYGKLMFFLVAKLRNFSYMYTYSCILYAMFALAQYANIA